jgi:hypothetical protein
MAVGLPRILDLLKKHSLRATFCEEPSLREPPKPRTGR